MKTKYIIIILIFIILIISLILIKNKQSKSIEISDIKHFSFSYSAGYTVYGRTRYEVDYKENKYIATILPYEVPDEDKLEIELDKKTVDKIIKVFNKYNISKWNGFNKVDKNVLDGNSFSFYLRMQNDNTIEASGYMKWPENYGKVRNELDSIFMKIYNKNGGKKNG